MLEKDGTFRISIDVSEIFLEIKTKGKNCLFTDSDSKSDAGFRNTLRIQISQLVREIRVFENSNLLRRCTVFGCSTSF